MLTENRIDKFVAIALISLLIAGCFLILRPFFSAILWAIILSFSTWPLYQGMKDWLKIPHTPASLLMVFTVAIILLLPLMLLAASFADNIAALFAMVKQLLKYGLPNPPAWLIQLPFIGAKTHDYWLTLVGSSAKLTKLLLQYLLPLRLWALRVTANMGEGIAYLSLSLFLTFFCYRDGATLAEKMVLILHRLGGNTALELLEIAGDTVKSVIYGIVGTALAQGFLAGFGFLVAGVPGWLLLGTLTCLLSLIPVGPPLIWIPATVWLFQQGDAGWAIFLGIWGVTVVSAVDNVLKPYFISKGSNLPFVLVLLGVLGGVLAFGLLGIFLGPTLLAIAYRLVQKWSN
jgi:predicted PurR-regulated permease PerM